MERHVRTAEELTRASGHAVVAHGRYRAAKLPVPGTAPDPGPADRAVLVLADATEVWLEPLEAPASIRPTAERQRLEGRDVRAHGVAYPVMPSTGAGVIDPCLTGVRVEADT